jgi:predicted phage terminase large subunit-like protein
MKAKDREALKDWEAHKKSIEQATAVDIQEDVVAKEKRIEKLKKNIELFAKYYFPHYCQSDFAPFHKRLFKKNIDNKKFFGVWKFARSHAKSVCAGVILPMYLKFTGELYNMLLASNNYDNAEELLKPLQMEFEANQRLINDFGNLVGLGTWESGHFVTSDGCSFRAVGMGQSPRGTRNQEKRPDYILGDDLDLEEVCRNKERLDNAQEWVMGALFGCFDITGTARFNIVGNVIHKDTIVLRCSEVADYSEQIDILSKTEADLKLVKQLQQGLLNAKNDDERKLYTESLNYAKAGYNPSWNRFTILDCVYKILKMGYRMAQREYFNNYIEEGKVFKKDWMQFKKLPPLRAYRFLVAYLDPGFKKTKTSDSKSLFLAALHEGKFHVRKVFCGKASVEEMIGWGYAIDEFVKKGNGTYKFKMEDVFLQDLLYKDFAEASKKKGYPLPVSSDKRKKPDKDARIEATSGYFERGDVYFDEDLKNDHHFQTFMEQLLGFQAGGSTKKDGPDAMEGCFYELQASVKLNADVMVNKNSANKHKI